MKRTKAGYPLSKYTTACNMAKFLLPLLPALSYAAFFGRFRYLPNNQDVTFSPICSHFQNQKRYT